MFIKLRFGSRLKKFGNHRFRAITSNFSPAKTLATVREVPANVQNCFRKPNPVAFTVRRKQNTIKVKKWPAEVTQ